LNPLEHFNAFRDGKLTLYGSVSFLVVLCYSGGIGYGGRSGLGQFGVRDGWAKFSPCGRVKPKYGLDPEFGAPF
jgi:hypothetical protein